MIHSILSSILGSQEPQEGEKDKGIGSLLVIGIILFILLGGLKLFQKPQEDAAGSCPGQSEN